LFTERRLALGAGAISQPGRVKEAQRSQIPGSEI
jgi:hypothetical protein